MTVAETGKVMDILKAAYPNWNATKNTLILWSQMFVDVPVETVGAAVKSYIATDEKGFAPSIGQINSIIHTRTDMSAMEAWRLVRNALSNSIYNANEEFKKLPPEVQRVVGSPDTLTEWAVLTNGLDTVVASNFMRSYEQRIEIKQHTEMLPESVRKALPW